MAHGWLWKQARILVLVAAAILAVGEARSEAGGFLENRGQLDPEVLFYATAARGAVYFTATGVVLEFTSPDTFARGAALAVEAEPIRSRERRAPAAATRYAVRASFARARPAAAPEGLGELPGTYTFFLGCDPEGWTSDVRSYDRIIYRGAVPGVDVVFRREAAGLTYEVVAAPPVDPSSLSFDYEGGTVHAGADGVWRIETPGGTIEDRRPSPPDRVGSIVVAHRSAVEPDRSGDSLAGRGIEGTTMELYWSTFLGGERDETVYAIDLDAEMRPVVVGTTRSPDFPTTAGALDDTYAGSFDAFVTKLSADGTSVVWSTLLGDTGDDRAWAVRLDAAGRPVIAGITGSTGFPVTAGAFDTTHNGGADAFVARLAADGSAIVWSTFFGGAGSDRDVSGLALDASDRPVFGGSTRSGDLPITSGAYDSVLGGLQDAFVASLSADGSALVYSTFLGGSGMDTVEDVAVDSLGRPVAVGATDSTDFPTSVGAFQSSLAGTAGQEDAFVAVLSPGADALVAGTYLGGDGGDEAFAVALDPADAVLVTGITRSSNLPTTAGAFSRTYGGLEDAFVARISPDATTLLSGTYFGGAAGDRGLDLAADADGRAVLVGWTCSGDFPTTANAYDPNFEGPCDTFLAKLEHAAGAPLYSSYVGGWRDESAYGLALDDSGRPVVGGETLSTNFPATPDAYQTASASPDEWVDGFVYSMDLPATWCTDVTGTSAPELLLGKAVAGSCPRAAPEGMLVDLIEGDLAQVGPASVGAVETIRCGSPEATFESASTPGPGEADFQLARFAPGGSYTDGGGPTLVGTRTPTSGDCP